MGRLGFYKGAQLGGEGMGGGGGVSEALGGGEEGRGEGGRGGDVGVSGACTRSAHPAVLSGGGGMAGTGFSTRSTGAGRGARSCAAAPAVAEERGPHRRPSSRKRSVSAGG